jgi:predicted nucleic acid-binding Zn ribbon protein
MTDFLKGLEGNDKKIYESISDKGRKHIESAFSKAAKATGKAAAASIKSVGDAMKAITEPTEQVLGHFTALVASTKEFQDQNQKFFQAGYSGQMHDFSKAISAANKASLDLNGNLAAASNVTAAFRDNTLAIAVASKDFTKTLMTAGVAMQGAGFEMSDFAQIVDTAAFAFNQNESEIKGLTSTLINVQREIPVSAGELAKNFQFAQKNFAYTADKMMDNFIDLQKMSTTTGVGFDQLMSAFSGDGMDTFTEAAEKAGKLNQILGKSAFNSMELLTMTEAERAKKVRSSIMESGRSIEDMGKFEILALGKTLGMDAATTRKFLRGDLKIDEKKSMKAIEAKDPTAMKSKQLGRSLDTLRTGIDRARPAADRFAIQLSKMSRAAATEIFMRQDAAKKLAAMGSTIDQILPAFAELQMGGAKMVKDPRTTTGIQRTATFDALERVQKIVDKLPPDAQAWGQLFAGSALASNDAAKAVLLASKAIEGIFTVENLKKIMPQEIAVKIFDSAGKQVPSAPMK